MKIQPDEDSMITIEESLRADPDRAIIDMQWDKGESNLMVAYSNGELGLVVYNGFQDAETGWKIIYEK